MVHDPLRTDRSASGQASTSETGADGEGERIAKVLARAGVASRRDVEKLIAEGRVAVNGKTLTEPGVKVDPSDIVTVDGEVVAEAEAVRVFRYHKPVGLVTSHKDPMGRPTVFAALPEGLPRLISVGRLDINSEGLLLLTNDGALARAFELPSTGIVRRYRARAHGRITQDKLDALKDGVTVEGVRYGPIEAKIDKGKEGPQGANLWLTVTLHEGKNREVRKVLESVGLKVNRLLRLSYGPFALGTLGVGEVEEVGPRVIREQLAEFILPENLPKGERPQWKSKAKAAPRRTPSAGAVAEGPVEPVRQKGEYKAGWAKPKPRKNAPPPRPDTGPKPAAKLTYAAKKASPPKPLGKPLKRSPGAHGPRPSRPPVAAAGARPERRERPEEAGPRPDRPQRAGPGPDGAKPAYAGHKARPSDRPDTRPERPARPAVRSDRPQRAGPSPDRTDKPAYAGYKARTSNRPDTRPERPAVRSDRPQRAGPAPDRSDKPAYAGQKARPPGRPDARPDRPQRGPGAERGGKPPSAGQKAYSPGERGPRSSGGAERPDRAPRPDARRPGPSRSGPKRPNSPKPGPKPRS